MTYNEFMAAQSSLAAAAETNAELRPLLDWLRDVDRKAYAAGEAAYNRGIPVSARPNELGEVIAQEWEAGWRQWEEFCHRERN